MAVLQRWNMDIYRHLSLTAELPGLDFHRFLLRGGSRFNETQISMVRFGEFFFGRLPIYVRDLSRGLWCSTYMQLLYEFYINVVYTLTIIDHAIGNMFLHRVFEELASWIKWYTYHRINYHVAWFPAHSGASKDYTHCKMISNISKNSRSLMVNLGWAMWCCFVLRNNVTGVVVAPRLESSTLKVGSWLENSNHRAHQDTTFTNFLETSMEDSVFLGFYWNRKRPNFYFLMDLGLDGLDWLL